MVDCGDVADNERERGELPVAVVASVVATET